eukprot:2918096-Pleurochrysis_carterae.AAC.4
MDQCFEYVKHLLSSCLHKRVQSPQMVESSSLKGVLVERSIKIALPDMKTIISDQPMAGRTRLTGFPVA